MANGQGFNPQIAPTVLGSGTQPLDYLLKNRALKARNEERKAILGQRQQENRDAAIGKLMEFSPDKAWEPYDKAIKGRANQLRMWTLDQLSAGANPSDPRFLAQRKQMEDQVNTMASGSQHLKTLHTQQYDLIDGNDYLNKDYYKNKLNSLIYSDDGLNGKTLSEVDFNAIKNVTDDAKGYNMDKIGKDFVDTLPDAIEKYYTERQNSLGGKFYNITEKKGKAIRSLDINPETETYDLNITDDVVLIAKDNAYLGKALEQFKEETGITDDKQALAKILNKYVPDPTRTSSLGRKITVKEGGPGKVPQKERELGRAKQVYESVWNGDKQALAAAEDELEGVTIDFYGGKDTGGGVRRDGIQITIKNDPIKVGNFLDEQPDTNIFWPTGTESQRRDTAIKLSKLIDERQRSATGQAIGTDPFSKAIEEYIKGLEGGKYGGIELPKKDEEGFNAEGYGGIEGIKTQ